MNERRLTTEQIEVLAILREAGTYLNYQQMIDDFSWDEIGVDADDIDEMFELFELYGYIDSDREITVEGKQYLRLFEEYVQSKEINPALEVNCEFTLLNIEKLGANFDILSDFGKAFEGFAKLAQGINKAIQSVKNNMQ